LTSWGTKLVSPNLRYLAGAALLGASILACWVLNVSRPGREVVGCPEGCSETIPQRGDSLKVISLNMLHGFPSFHRLQERIDLIASEILSQDADIVCLQEVPWTLQLGNAAEYLARRVGMNYVYLRANGNRSTILFEEGEAILSRHPLRDVDSAELLPQAGFFEHRMVLSATAATPYGEVGLFVTHLTHGDPEINRGQVDSLITYVLSKEQRPAIIAGDFNASEDSPQIQALTRVAVDGYRLLHPDDDGFTCCLEDLDVERAEHLERRIDYIFLLSDESRRVTVTDCQRVFARPSKVRDGWLWASDHVGVMATISWPQSED
jgi:endonuclease/exonuclease/phosphatase family metal-dependent hydrolase